MYRSHLALHLFLRPGQRSTTAGIISKTTANHHNQKTTSRLYNTGDINTRARRVASLLGYIAAQTSRPDSAPPHLLASPHLCPYLDCLENSYSGEVQL